MRKLDYKTIREILWSADVQEALQAVLLKEFPSEIQENGLIQIENDYENGWERLSAVLRGKQENLLEDLEVLCSDEAKIAFRIAFERGQYAGFQHFFQPDEVPLTFEGLGLNKLLTVPEVMRFPEYDRARMQVNELETELAEQLDPFSREHLTSITYAWEERTMAMLRYGFALGHRMAIDVIQGVTPEQSAKLIESGWRVAQETNVLLSGAEDM